MVAKPEAAVSAVSDATTPTVAITTTEVGRIITSPVTVNDVEFSGFSIPGLTQNDEIWFQLGRMTTTIEYDEMVFKADGEFVRLAGISDPREPLEDGWRTVESFSLALGDY